MNLQFFKQTIRQRQEIEFMDELMSSKQYLHHCTHRNEWNSTQSSMRRRCTRYAMDKTEQKFSILELRQTMLQTLVLEKKEKTLITMKQYYNFIGNWPKLHAVKTTGLSDPRAKESYLVCISKYFKKLKTSIDKHGVEDKFRLILNVDERK